MANSMTAVAKSVTQAATLEDASSSVVPANPEVVAVPRREQFSPADKRRILSAADQCSEPGQIGALLRREGIYSSHLSTWRKQRAAGLDTAKRGPKADAALPVGHRTAKLTRQINRLQWQLATRD